jgi:hypothetical protein
MALVLKHIMFIELKYNISSILFSCDEDLYFKTGALILNMFTTTNL